MTLEAFIGGYPKGLDFGVRLGMRSSEGRDEFKTYFESAIEYSGPHAERIAKVAKSCNVHIVVGVVERDGGTLYCSVRHSARCNSRSLTPSDVLLRPRRQPTREAQEVDANRAGASGLGLRGRIDAAGAANTDRTHQHCYLLGELYASAAHDLLPERYSSWLFLHALTVHLGVQLYLAPTVDDRESWLPTMRTIAMEGRCFVISACQFLKPSDFPEGHPARSGDQLLIRGGSCAVSPMGEVLLERDFESECVRIVECDLDEIPRAKFDLDVVGHYARPDVFTLTVNEKPQKAVLLDNE